MDKKIENFSKEAVLEEYLTGSISYLGLEAKYGKLGRSIRDWIMEFLI